MSVAEQDNRQSEEHLDLLQTITMEVAAATDLSSALKVVLRRVCEKTGWAFGQAWLPDAQRTHLDCGPAWFADDADLKQFRDDSLQFHFERGVGLPGRVWQSKKPTWVEHLSSDRKLIAVPRPTFWLTPRRLSIACSRRCFDKSKTGYDIV